MVCPSVIIGYQTSSVAKVFKPQMNADKRRFIDRKTSTTDHADVHG